MHQQALRSDASSDWVEFRLLDAVDSGRFRSQREAAAELGIALGLVNSYVKRCVRKGWLKVSEVPARRYAYYLTPQGFDEKARLSLQYLRSSMRLFRKARKDYSALLARAEMFGWQRTALWGMSDLTEIACLCSLESEIKIAAIIASDSRRTALFGVSLIAELASLPDDCDGLVLTEMGHTTPEYEHPKGRTFQMLIPDFLHYSLFESPSRGIEEAS